LLQKHSLGLQAVRLVKVPANFHGGRVDQEEAAPDLVVAWQQAGCCCCFWVADGVVIYV
jgi:hypothetical protein